MRAVRSPWVRGGFLALAVGAAVVAVALEWEGFVDGLRRLPWWAVPAAIALSVANITLALLSWRVLLAELGAPLHLRNAVRVYLVGQVGKYLPGGVWNVVAAGELAADHGVARRRTVGAMAVSVVLSGATAVAVGSAFLTWADGVSWATSLRPWAVPATLLAVAAVAPPVLNRVLAVGLRLLRRPPLAADLSWRGIATAAAFTTASWLAIGGQLWVLALGAGAEPLGPAALAALGGYPLAWVIGALVVVVPSGAGVREIALLAVLAPFLATGPALAVVLLSRICLTVSDLGTALGALTVARHAGVHPNGP